MTAIAHPSTRRATSEGGYSGARPTLRVRLRVRLHRWRLDRELAHGYSREDSAAQVLRARQLATPETRHQLASALRRVAADSENRGGALFRAAVPVRRTEGPWREALLGLAELARAAGRGQRLWHRSCTGASHRRNGAALQLALGRVDLRRGVAGRGRAPAVPSPRVGLSSDHEARARAHRLDMPTLRRHRDDRGSRGETRVTPTQPKPASGLEPETPSLQVKCSAN